MRSLSCGHQFCSECWTNWLNSSMDKGAECIFTCCIQFKCKNIVPGAFFQRMVDKNQRKKLEGYLATAFVRTNTYLKWCPGPGCDKAVEYHKTVNAGMKSVQCTCGFLFCFGCGGCSHDPSPCDVVAKWNSKNSAESSIFQWIKKNKSEQDVKNCTKVFAFFFRYVLISYGGWSGC